MMVSRDDERVVEGLVKLLGAASHSVGEPFPRDPEGVFDLLSGFYMYYTGSEAESWARKIIRGFSEKLKTDFQELSAHHPDLKIVFRD